MRNILVAATAGTLLALAGGSSLAQVPDMRGPAPGEPLVETSRVSAGVVPPRLVLPNIPALTIRLMRSDRDTAQKQLVASRRVVAFWENRGHWLRATRHLKCWTVPWQRSCTVARASYRLHLTLAVAAEQKLWKELPLTDDFVTAVRIVQRVFPGTYGITLSCADSEGGRGRWVPNNQGSGVGGWMQFYPSTFWRMFTAAKAEAERKGFSVPAEAASWYSPLGQALAGAWGMIHRRSEWHGAGCHSDGL